MSRLKSPSTSRKGIAALVVALLALGAGAYAYFTSTGSGTGNATVGSASNWTVATDPPTGGSLLPGSGSMTVGYTVTNPNAGAQQLNATAAALTTDTAGGVFDTTSGAFVDACLASWFTATNSPPQALPTTLAGGASTTGSVSITMQDSGTNQDACQNLTPQVTVTAS